MTQFRLLVAAAFLLAFSPLAAAQQASLILTGGKVWTENASQPTAQAVAVAGNRILAVGSDVEIRKLAGPHTRAVNLRGRSLLPGFNDAHVHLLDGGALLISAQLGSVRSHDEFRQRIQTYAETLPKNAWIRGGGWDHQRWTPASLPNHQLIDEVCGDHPALLWRLDGHMALANALALQRAGIDRNTKDAPGGEIERDENGDPTGILKDAATGLVERIMPRLSAQEVDRAMQVALGVAAEHGITSVQNMAGSSVDRMQPDTLRVFEKREREGRLTVRIYEAEPVRDFRNLANAGIVAPFGSALLRIGNLKAFADGSLGSETAWMDEPFADRPDYRGLGGSDLLDSEHFYDELRQADQAGLQISIHAIGDRANRTILDLYARLEKENGPADRRLRIEHVQHLHPADYPRFAQLGVVASMQPYHAIDDGRWAINELGSERIKSSYAWKSLLDAGATLAFGSDWPVAPLDALIGIYAATTRRTLDGKNPNGWIPEQRITVAQAVHAYTVGSAYAEHQETVKGSIKKGMLADLVVLSDDIFAIPPESIDRTRVDMTIFDGQIIFQRAAAGDGPGTLNLR
jgi:predicted amidohydrolase YtcJ